MDELSDDSLVSLSKEGNLDAFTELVHRYQGRIYQTIFQFAKNHRDTDDLAQETFMKAFKSLGDFKQKASFYTWVYKIAVNLSLNFLKKRQREKVRESFREDYSPKEANVGRASSPENYFLKKELGKKLEEAIDTLPLAYKASFILVNNHGMSHGQAAKVLSCSEKTISWRMHKARKMLQEKLKSYI